MTVWLLIIADNTRLSGERSVRAADGEEAIAKVRRWARSQTSMVMCSESYQTPHPLAPCRVDTLAELA